MRISTLLRCILLNYDHEDQIAVFQFCKQISFYRDKDFAKFDKEIPIFSKEITFKELKRGATSSSN